MKKFRGLKLMCSSVTAFCLLNALTGCNTIQSDYETQGMSQEDYFDFKTVNSSTLTLDLGVPGETAFYLYEENPVVTLADESVAINSEIEPIYADVTDAEGKLERVITLPAYLKKVWLVAEHVYLPLTIEIDVVESSISYNHSLEA
ncbi:MAG: hypothetical protein ACRC8J_09825, partial [Phocaeicola sp.]